MKVVIADQYPLYRDALRHLLERLTSDLTVVETSDLAATQAALEGGGVDLLLVDLALAAPGRLRALSDLHQLAPATAVVVFSSLEQVAYVREAHERGAVGFIPKTMSSQLVANALQLIISGGSYFPPGLLSPRSGNGEAGRNAPAPRDYVRLTPRQQEVFARLLSGKSSRQIANELDISEGTVRVHLANIYRLFGVDNRIQAVRRAIELGMAEDMASTSTGDE